MRLNQSAREELNLAEGECCLLLDIACYNPNNEDISFYFMFGGVQPNDYKINRRYPNKSYLTLTKKYGRKLSKMGYPYIMKLSEQAPKRLTLFITRDGKRTPYIFPLQTSMTDEAPVCDLTCRYNAKTGEIKLGTHGSDVDDDLKWHFWSTKVPESGWRRDITTQLTFTKDPSFVCAGESGFIADTVITPAAVSLEKLFTPPHKS